MKFNFIINYLGVIIWTILTSAWVYDFYIFSFTISSLWILCMLHLKYQFTQLNLEIRDSIASSQHWKLLILFKHHINLEKEAWLLNEEMKYYIYILYNFVKPCFNVFVYLYFEPESKVLAKINIMLQIILVALLIFIMNYLCASVTAAAHKSQSTLYNTALNKGQNIPLRIRTKIMRFIERLSGPEIGFYCFDLFPMTSYNFTDYVFDSIVSYLLILKLLKRSGITI